MTQSDELSFRKAQPAKEESVFALGRWDGSDIPKLAAAAPGSRRNSVLLPPHHQSVSRWPGSIFCDAHWPDARSMRVERHANGLSLGVWNELLALPPILALLFFAPMVLTFTELFREEYLIETAIYCIATAFSIEFFRKDRWHYFPLAISILAFVYGLVALVMMAFNALAHFIVMTEAMLTVVTYASLRGLTGGYAYRPVLFDRAAGKIHIFRDLTSFWFPMPPLGGGQYAIDTYDWSCVRMQIVATGVSVPEYTGTYATGTKSIELTSLEGIALKAPDSSEIAGTFQLPIFGKGTNIQTLLDQWEYLRRYMEHEPFEHGEAPAAAQSRRSLLGAVFFAQPMIGPGSQAFRASTEISNRVMIALQVLAALLFPLTVAIGLAIFISEHVQSQPRWPQEVLSSIDGQPGSGPPSDGNVQFTDNSENI